MTVECMSISALQFSQALAYLDTTQQEINTSLKSHGDMLKQVQSFTTHHCHYLVHSEEFAINVL